MSRKFRPPFRAFQGFLELIPAGGLWPRIENVLGDTCVDLRRLAPAPGADPNQLTFKQGEKRGYVGVRIVETFLDFDCLKLDQILAQCQDVFAERQARPDAPAIPTVQMLLMSPFSQIAQVRYAALTAAEPGRWAARSPLEHTNRKLHEIVGMIARTLGEERPECPSPTSNSFIDQMEACDKLTEIVNTLGARAGFEIRFYDKFTDAPIYFFGKFIFKGVILDRTAAASNPWLSFVDDPIQRDDLYDSLIVRLDDLWADAHTKAMQYGLRTFGENHVLRAFIAMPMANERSEELDARKEAIIDACETFDRGGPTIQALRIDDIAAVNRSIDDVMVESIRDADIMIADLSDNRSNVYYEVGLAQAMNKPVVLVAHEANGEVGFDLRNYRVYRFGTIAQLKDVVAEALDVIFRKLNLIRNETVNEDAPDGPPAAD